MNSRIYLVAFLICGFAATFIDVDRLAAQRLRENAVAENENTAPGQEDEKGADGDDVSDSADAPAQPPTEPLDPRFIRFRLIDGSIVSGILSIDAFDVQTEFGMLTVPVEQIVFFRPGLESYPELNQRIQQLFADLKSDTFHTRERAQTDLIRYGLQIEHELDRHDRDENAELKRRLAEIRKAIDELKGDNEDDFYSEFDQAWIRNDTVVTLDFTIVGKIVEQSFDVDSKYGPLIVKLSDIKKAERPSDELQKIVRAFKVDGSNFVQRKWKSTAIRVKRGDRISVNADGKLTMTPWGNNQFSTPDGAVNFGWYVQNQIPGGALCAKIGNSGKEFKIGGRHTFTAQSTGLLYLGIAMQHQYAGTNYNYPGEYKVRVRVEPISN